ncbi:hypothetical protein VYU27_010055, partial [Nannochloropsis oceanica]
MSPQQQQLQAFCLQKASSHRSAARDMFPACKSPRHVMLLLLVFVAATTQAFLLPSPSLVHVAQARTMLARQTVTPTTTTRVTGAATNERADAVDPDSSSSSAKGAVTLGPYKNGALVVALPKPTVTEAQVEAAVKAAGKKTFKLTPVRFVEEGGTRMGHTVVCDWKATYIS